MRRKPYLYVQSSSQAPMYFEFTTLAACVKEVNLDSKAGLPAGVIYVRYSRVASLLRENAKLRAKLEELA